jgi:type II secretion system protein N
MTMKARLITIAKWTLYPLFYLFALVMCVYLTFPWDRVKERVIAEFAKTQAGKGTRAWRLEIGELDGYWFTGVEIENAKIIMPPGDEDEPAATGSSSPLRAAASKKASSGGDGDSGSKSAAAKIPQEIAINIDSAHARLRILPLLIGRMRVDFGAELFGGSIEGTVPMGAGTVDVEMENLDLARIAPLRELIDSPIQGTFGGKFELVSDTGKFSKASGSLAMTIADATICDGKAKCLTQMGIPQAKLGTLEISAKVTDGVLKFEKFAATGQDMEFSADGTFRIKQPWDTTTIDVYLKFGFSDAYKNKTPETTALFVPDGALPAAIDLVPKLQRAKREDGMWGFHAKGTFKRPKFDPTKVDGPGKRATGTEKPATTTSTSKSRKKTPAKTTDDAPDPMVDEPAPTPVPMPLAPPPKEPEPTPEPVAEPAPAPEPEPVPPPEPNGNEPAPEPPR